jgi:hypothetical protein
MKSLAHQKCNAQLEWNGYLLQITNFFSLLFLCFIVAFSGHDPAALPTKLIDGITERFERQTCVNQEGEP